MSFSYKRRRPYSTAARNRGVQRNLRAQFPNARRGAFSSANIQRAFARGAAARPYAATASVRMHRINGRLVRRGMPGSAMVKQVKGLLAAKTRDAVDVNLGITAYQSVVTAGLCTSSTTLASAVYGSGILQTDADEVLINSLRVRGMFLLPATLLLDASGHYSGKVRRLVVWFNKPLAIAVAGGVTLPPLTEVLTDLSLDALPLNEATNAGRFTILSDRLWDIGTNTFQSAIAAGSARVNGRLGIVYDYTVKVGRKCSFKAPSTPGVGAGGHYDQANATGQLGTGLLMMYTLYDSGGAPSTITDTYTRRLNYTG